MPLSTTLKTAKLRKELQGNIRALEALKSDIPIALEEQAHALATYEQARLRLSTLCFRNDCLLEDSENIRRTLNTMGSFPFELLSLIFTYANTPDNQLMGLYDEHLYPSPVDVNRAALPYRLGSVSRHWRQAALSSPTLWSYIGISYKVMARRTQCLLCSPTARFFTALERSGCVPLEVIIHSRDRLAADPRDGLTDADALTEESQFFLGIFRHLHGNIHRVRTLHVDGLNLLHRSPSHALPVYDRVMDLLRAPTPILSELRVSFETRPWHSVSDIAFWLNFPAHPFPLFLPHAPKLQQLSVNGAPLVCRRPHPGLPSLRHLHIVLDIMHAQHLHDMLAVAPCLQHLSLNVDEALNLSNSTIPPAPCLETLEVLFGESFDLLSNGVDILPKLRYLVLHDLSEISVTAAFVQRLQRLKINCQHDIHDHIGTLRRFENIEHIEFGGNTTMRDDVFFGELLATEDPMWPKLKTIKMCGLIMQSVEKDGLLRLLQARNCRQNLRARPGDPPTPCPIEAVLVDGDGYLPQWMEIAIRSLVPHFAWLE